MPFAGFAAITLPRMRVVVLAVGQGLPGYTAAVQNVMEKITSITSTAMQSSELCWLLAYLVRLVRSLDLSGTTELNVFVWTAGKAGFHSSPKINWADSILTMAKKGV